MTAEENTYVYDPEDSTEMARLMRQDRIITKDMGGALRDIPEHALGGPILDIACGTGGWVLDVAYALPETEVMGIDISQQMISYANARALSEGRINASFGIMNILDRLDFDDNTFSFVNTRFLGGVLRSGQWRKVINEFVRILRPQGILRLTECDNIGLTTSPAFEELSSIFCQAIQKVGYGFSPDGKTFGHTPILEHLLREAGLHSIQKHAHALNFSYWSEHRDEIRDNAHIAFRQAIPLLEKVGLANKEKIEQLLVQMQIETLAEGFCGVWHYMSAWGEK